LVKQLDGASNERQDLGNDATLQLPRLWVMRRYVSRPIDCFHLLDVALPHLWCENLFTTFALKVNTRSAELHCDLMLAAAINNAIISKPGE